MNSEEIVKKREKENNNFNYLESVQDFKKQGNILNINCDQGRIVLKFISDNIIRVMGNINSEIDFSTTPAITDDEQKSRGKEPEFEVRQEEKSIKVIGDELIVKIVLSPFALKFLDKEGNLINEDIKGQALAKGRSRFQSKKKIKAGERFYGLGETTGFLDKRGRRYTMWNTDNFGPHVEDSDPLYQSIPFLIGFDGSHAYGLYYDNSYKSIFDLGETDKNKFIYEADGGQLDYYFIKGPEIRQVIQRYTELTGTTPLPPRWALGYHQSRYSYYPEAEVQEIAREFRDREIPCDGLHLDIDYMDGYRIFTWDKQGFPQPRKLLTDLKEKGFKPVTIIDPGVKKDPNYHVYQEGCRQDYFCKYMDGTLYYGEVWPGICAFPDFASPEVREWWGKLNKTLLEQGVEGIWNDMNEPSVFDSETYTVDENVVHEGENELMTHARFHNLYALREAEATYQSIKEYKQERPFILTRAGFAGIQRYAAVWTGDNRSYWDHLRMAVPMLMNMGLSGISFAGTDIGGFTGDSGGELLTRWTQLGTFMPFFRNHSVMDSRNQEPWAFGENYTDINRKFIQLRYRLLPYLYNLFVKSANSGMPVLRPLVVEYPEDENTYNLFDQFLLGSSLMVAPIYQPDKTERAVYLPAGDWYDFWNNDIYTGGQSYVVKAPLAKIPVFVRAGSIIPMGPAVDYVGQTDKEDLTFYVYPDVKGNTEEFEFYEDDGISFNYKNGEYSQKQIQMKGKDEKTVLEVKEAKSSYDSRFENYIFKIMNPTFSPELVLEEASSAKENNNYEVRD